MGIDDLADKWARKTANKGSKWARETAKESSFTNYKDKLGRKLDIAPETIGSSDAGKEWKTFASNASARAADYDKGVSDPNSKKRWKEGMRGAFGGA